jgi:hypothetical protein
MSHGPNVTKLITKFITREAIPPGGGLADGIEFFTNPEHRKQILVRAELSAMAAIQAIRLAPDNPYGDNDEVIAKVILDKIALRESETKCQTK